MEYKINNGIWGNMFGVPCIVADNLLKLVTGDNLKVLLYLLRNSGKTVTTEEIHAATGVSKQQVEDSIIFWEQINIFSPENRLNQSKTANNIMTAPAPPAPQPAKSATETDNTPSVPESMQKSSSPASRKMLYSPSEITRLKDNNTDIAELLQAIQGLIINPNNYMVNSIIWIYEYLGLKTEVIMTLLTYCATIGKISTDYIEDLARKWAEKEIDTLEKSQIEAARLLELRSYTSKIMKIFHISRTTPNIKKMIENCHQSGYNMEMIQYAYEITIENTGDFSFPYINKIFNNWIEKGIKTIDDARNDNAEYKKNFKPKVDNSDGFDADEYEIFLNNF